MGPLAINGIITENTNLFLAFIIGIGFGFVLEQSGFSSSRKLAGVFYGYDTVVLKVFFTAAITAMLGLLFFSLFGWVDLRGIGGRGAGLCNTWRLFYAGLGAYYYSAHQPTDPRSRDRRPPVGTSYQKLPGWTQPARTARPGVGSAQRCGDNHGPGAHVLGEAIGNVLLSARCRRSERAQRGPGGRLATTFRGGP